MKDFYNSSGDREGLYYNKPGDTATLSEN